MHWHDSFVHFRLFHPLNQWTIEGSKSQWIFHWNGFVSLDFSWMENSLINQLRIGVNLIHDKLWLMTRIEWSENISFFRLRLNEIFFVSIYLFSYRLNGLTMKSLTTFNFPFHWSIWQMKWWILKIRSIDSKIWSNEMKWNWSTWEWKEISESMIDEGKTKCFIGLEIE